MQISPLFFYLFAILAVVCALLVVLKTNPVTSAFNLVMVFFAFAGIYALLGAHLIAGLQILVYTGAIMVLFVFVIMLLRADSPSLDLARGVPAFRLFVGAGGAAALAALFAWVFKHARFGAVDGPGAVAPGPYTEQAIEAAGGNTQVISELMFSEYLLPFELTSVLLLAAIVGVVAIALRQAKRPGVDQPQGLSKGAGQ